ncbi:hypothetical protein PYV02_14690 [Leifsonia sp. H3M29-4]|jgi:hypothetical protein|uniref:hypothetical protein n=1 Tax=Salinibacterium metalliresistens TaxID=3031321 RepID=UPI0023DCA035|nr:hypothetical protein [Salinibacterium metalliresistens]MDF1480330.1 hypothetical protein [Salinibacterium metalliresistens]
MADLSTSHADELIKRVAAELPFRVNLEADMGGTFGLQIDLGTRGGQDDPPDTAGIDPGPGARWWIDVEGGRESIVSSLGADADPSAVAEWVAAEARKAGSPAAASPAAIAGMGFASPAAAAPTARTSSRPAHAAPELAAAPELGR